MMMSEIAPYVKFISIIQLALIPFGVVFLFLAKIVLKMKKDKKEEIKKQMTSGIQNLITTDHQLSKLFTKLCMRHIDVLIDCFFMIEQECSKNTKWLLIKTQLIDSVLKPRARVLAKSHRWINQYLAVQCYAYGIDLKDESLLLKLIHHKILLVCLGAACVVFKYPTTQSVDVLIDVLAKGRRLNQSFFIEVLTKISFSEKKRLAPFFTVRLECEEDPYVRSFCYRMAMHLAASTEVLTRVKQDALSNNLELKLAAINYLSINHSIDSLNFLIKLIDDKQFEVRALIVKLLGKFHHETVLPLLENKLKDPAWWVRINSADSLLKLGKEGIAVLQRQSPEDDRFAYETAQKVLVTLHQSDKDF